jgi:hypothetical protein
MTATRFFLIAAALAVATPALAQEATVTVASTDTAGRAAPPMATPPDTQPTKTKAKSNLPRYIAAPMEIQYMRSPDQRGINVFESPKEAGAAYTGFKLAIGGAFAQQFQNLTHQNTAAAKPGKDASSRSARASTTRRPTSTSTRNSPAASASPSRPTPRRVTTRRAGSRTATS